MERKRQSVDKKRGDVEGEDNWRADKEGGEDKNNRGWDGHYVVVGPRVEDDGARQVVVKWMGVGRRIPF